MAKKISSSDLFSQEDLFKGVRDSAQAALTMINQLNAAMKTSAEGLKATIKNSDLGSASGLRGFNQAASKANQLKEDAIRLEIMQKKLTAEMEAAEKSRLSTERERLKLENDSAKAAARTARAEADKDSAYKALVKTTRDLKNASKELGAQMLKLEADGKKNTKEFREIEKQYKATTQQAQLLDQKLKGLDKSVGDNFRNIGNYKNAIRGLQSGLGQLGIAFGVGAVFQSATEKIIEFDQAIADLQAITGASGNDLEFYKKQANEMGVAVEGGAAAVVEAYKLIGSAKPELLTNAAALNEVTKSAITLSQASGMTLPESASALTDAMNQFGADAKEAERYINVLANGAKYGAVEIPQVTDALLKFGVVAKTSNVSIEESTALIELLGEKGLKGADAGTALRNVMLKLAAPDALPKEAQKRLTELGISFEQLNNEAVPFSERLTALKPLLTDNATLVKVFGLENAVAATSLIGNIDRVKELESQMYVQGTATEQATQRTNTLGHALLELQNEFSKMFTSIESGSGSMQMFIDGLKFLARNLGTIFSMLGKVTVAWLGYRAALVSIQAYQFITSGGLKELAKELVSNISLTKQAAKTQEQLGKSSVIAGEGVAKAGKALSSIAWVAIIGFLVELATKWYDVASGAAEARRQADMYAKAKEDADKVSNDTIDQTQKRIDESLRLLDLEIRKRKANGEKEKALDEEKALRSKEIFQNEKNNYEESIRLAKEKLASDKKIFEETSKLPDMIESSSGGAGGMYSPTTSTFVRNPAKYNIAQQEQAFRTQEQLVNNLTAGQKTFNDQLEESQVQYLETTSKANDYSVVVADNTGKVGSNVKAHQELKTALKEVDDYLERTIELEQQLIEIRQKRQLAKADVGIEKDIANAVKLAAEEGKVAVAKETELYDEIEKKIIERYNLEKTFILQRATIAIAELQKQYALENQLEKNKLIDERDTLLKQEDLTAAQKEDIQKSYQTRLAQLGVEQSQRELDMNKEIQLINEKAADDQVKLEVDKDKEINTYNDRLNEALKSNAESTNKEIKSGNDDIIKSEKDKYKTLNDFVKASADFFITQSEKKMSQIDKEIESANKQYDILKSLAENGNIDAQQSLAAQQKVLDDKERQRMVEMKRQERIKLAQSIFSTYSAKLESGDKNALSNTIKDATVLTQFVQSLPAFLKGTEDTGVNGYGVDGKGGFLSVLHPNERVIPKELNSKMSGITNEELAKIAVAYKTNEFMTSIPSFQQADSSDVVNELKSLKRAIEQKPETNISLGEIMQGAMEIVQTTKRGNKTVYNRYRIK